MKLAQLAAATASNISQGSADLEIISAAGLDIAQAGDVTFLANPKYTPQIKETRAAAIFLNENVEIDRDDIAVLRAKDAYVAYTLALRLFFPTPPIAPGIHRSAVVDETASVAENVEIQANVVVGKNCVIESGVKIFPNVTLYDNTRVGREPQVVIRAEVRPTRARVSRSGESRRVEDRQAAGQPSPCPPGRLVINPIQRVVHVS